MTTLRSACSIASLLAACADGALPEGEACGLGSTLIAGQCVPMDPTSGSESGSESGSGSGSESDSDSGSSGSSDGGSTGAASSTGDAPIAIDLHDAIIHDNAPDIADWPVTTAITLLRFQDDGVYVEFSKKDGDGRWPDITPPGWDGPLQYTLGLVELIDGQWHASAAMQYWYGLEAQGGNVALDNQVAINWYYDARWGEMAGYQPATGEMIGVFIVAGNLRGVLDGSQSPVMERSDVVVVPMPAVQGATHEF